MPEMNMAPEVADPKTFATLPGKTMYRTVNAQGGETALDICGRTLSSDVTTVGAGRMGDGFYFHINKTASQAYGSHSNNLQKTATMAIKLNKNAKVVSENSLRNMLNKEKPSVQKAVHAMRSGGNWDGYSGYCAYALRKGYNVVSDGAIYNIIDRRAATWSGQVVPK